MGVIQDRTTGYWTLKTRTAEGKDKRVKLREVKDGESNKPIPPDVVALAASKGGSAFVPQTSTLDNSTSTLTDNSTSTLKGFVESHFAEYRQHKRPGSTKRLRGILDRFLGFASTTGVETVESVTEDTIKGFFKVRLDQVDPRLKIKVKPQTALSELELLSGVFTAAKRQKLIPDNPVSEVVRQLRPSYPRIETTKYLEPETIKAFLNALDKGVSAGLIPQDYADLAVVMLNTGMRVGAAVNMEHGWVNYKSWTVSIPPEWDKAKTGYTTAVAPGGRVVLERRRDGSGGRGRVFPLAVNQNMSYYFLRKVCEEYGVEVNGSFNHTLRHTNATCHVDHGTPTQVIMELLGQKNLKTTQRYAKVREQAKIRAVESLSF